MADPCGLSDFNRIETYGRAELFLTLVGTDVSRSVYELTAQVLRLDVVDNSRYSR